MAEETKKPEEKPGISLAEQAIANLMARFGNFDKMDKDEMDEMMNKIMKIWTFKMFSEAITGDNGKKSEADEYYKRQLEDVNRRYEEVLRKLEMKEQEEIQDRKLEKVSNSFKEEIKPIKDTIEKIKSEAEKQPDPTIVQMREKMEKLEQMLADMDKKKDQDSYSSLRSELRSQLDKFESQLENLQAARDRGDPIDQLLTQMERLEQTKQRLGKLLGISSKEVSEMTPTQIIDTIAQKGPELFNSARTMYDIVKGKELTDENPEPVIPQTPAPVTGPQEPKLQPDLQDFIDEGHEEYIDPNDKSKGKAWVSKYGIPIQSATGQLMNREDVVKYGLVYPDDLRNIKKQMEDAIREEQEKAPPPPPPPEPEQKPPVESKENPPAEKKTETEKQEKKEVEVTDEMLDAATKPAE